MLEITLQYPNVAPALHFKDVKGLGDVREAKLLKDLQTQVAELSGGPLLVATCEVFISIFHFIESLLVALLPCLSNSLSKPVLWMCLSEFLRRLEVKRLE
jgi:hypothetical protein